MVWRCILDRNIISETEKIMNTAGSNSIYNWKYPLKKDIVFKR